MKETDTHYYCDVTGEPIRSDELFDAIEVELDYGSSGISSPRRFGDDGTLHISQDAHGISATQLTSGWDLTAIVSKDSGVLALEVESQMGSKYVGPETGSEDLSTVMDLIDRALDGRE